MIKFALIFSMATFAAATGFAQSLKPNEPYPLKDGINTATSDSLVGTHYWYFFAAPGSNRVTVRLKQATTLYGANMKTTLSVTLSDAKRTWHTTKFLTASPNGAEVSFAADNIKRQQKIIVAVAPPNQNLLRMGGDYEIEATGSVIFNGEDAGSDPVIRTYASKLNGYGATRFLADGSIIAADGTRGTWTAFDPDNGIYTVIMGKFNFSVMYRPGYGLVKPSDPNLIIFQEIRR